MIHDLPLPPHFEQFIREQVAAGRFKSEGDVIQAALSLLEEQSHVREAADAWLKREMDKGLNSRPSAPVTKAFWDDCRDKARAVSSGDDA